MVSFGAEGTASINEARRYESGNRRRARISDAFNLSGLTNSSTVKTKRCGEKDYYPKNDPSAIPRLMKETELKNQGLPSENFLLWTNE